MTSPQQSNLQPPTPDLDDRQRLALLCRILQREGYDDHLAGHITVTQDDGSLLVNPFGLRWEELTAADILRIDLEGNVLEGAHPVNPGVMLHLALHAKRDDVRWTIHNHSRWGTVWAGAHRAPPAYDQSSTYCGSIAVVNEYEGAVNDPGTAARVVDGIGTSNVAILAGHGVLVMASDVNIALTRAISLEIRCRNAWHVETLGGGQPVAAEVAKFFDEGLSIAGFPGLWEALVRRELRLDPGMIDTA
jgi:L-fuculose-phosphate aldolase